jgi:hypothetical protein
MLRALVVEPEAAADLADAFAWYETQRPGLGSREVVQARARLDAKLYLIRVFLDVDRDPPEVVTVYRTSRVAKYWRTIE